MNKLLLLFLTIPLAALAVTKCPEDYLKFPRTPKAKNNYTKEWCLGVFEHNKSGERDYARGVCNHHNGTLSLPENELEFNVISVWLNNWNMSHVKLAVDGEFSPHCKTLLMKKVFNARKRMGDCNYKNNLFAFDDPNTDPTFALQRNLEGYPNGFQSTYIGDVEFKQHAGCLDLTPNVYNGTHWKSEADVKNHTKSTGYFHLDYCNGVGLFTDDGKKPESNVKAVLCGTRPV